MQITCYSGFSKKPNSTKQPTGSGTAKTVTLKEPTSVLNPVFILTGYDLSYNYIQWGSRYYFVDDIVIVHNNIAEYHCSTDVLATYKTAIGASTQYVTRADSSYNLNILDIKYPSLSKTEVENVPFSNLHSSMVNGGSFVIGIANGIDANSAGISYYCLTGSEMRGLMEYMFGGTWLDAMDISTELQKELVNPYDYIDSIMWFPFDIPNSDVPFTPKRLQFGFWDYTGTGGLMTPGNASKGFAETIQIPTHPQSARGMYLNGNPYTRLMLDCYSFGMFAVDSSVFTNDNNLTLGISIDFLSGMGKLTLRAGSNAKLIHKAYAMVGVPMKKSQVSQNLLGSALAVTGGAFNVALGNFVGYSQGIMSGVQAIMPHLNSSGTNGSRVAFVTAPELVITRQRIVDEDKAQFGRPLCETKVINTLTGYIECENADLDLAASPTEKDAVIGYLNSGFYYE